MNSDKKILGKILIYGGCYLLGTMTTLVIKFIMN